MSKLSEDNDQNKDPCHQHGQCQSQDAGKGKSQNQDKGNNCSTKSSLSKY